MYGDSSKLKRTRNPLVLFALIFLMTLGFVLPAAAEDNLTPVPATTTAAIQLSDIQGNWAASQISDWVNKGLVKGYQDGTFRPDKEISRAEFMTMANRAFGFTAIATTQFNDVSASDWFAGEIGKAKAAAYISGYQDGTIRPNAAISRQEAAAMLIHLAKLETSTDTAALSKFKDAGDIPAWSQAAINAVSNKNFMRGYPDQTFQAARNISRAEAIVTLDNVIRVQVPVKTGKIFDKAGSYGNAASLETINGDVTISVSGVTLQHMKITGNLILAEGIGDGDVTLKKVTVQGTSTIKGGGAHSITLEDCTLPSITINKEGVRVVAAGNTSVTVVQLESGATLVQTTTSALGFGDISVSEIIPAGANISLTGNFTNVNVAAAKVNVALTSGTISKLEVLAKASGSKFDLASGTKVNTLTLNAAVTVSGQGVIDTAKINAPGTGMAQTPGKVENPNNVNINIGNSSLVTGTGTGTGTGGGNNPLSFVSSDPADGSTDVANTPIIKLTFDRGVVRDYWENNQNCFTLTSNSGQSVAISVSRAGDYLTSDSEKRNIYVTPASSLTAGGNYTLTVSASLKANNGNTLGTARTISFAVAGSSGGGGGNPPAVGILTISDGDGRSNLNAKASNGPADGAQTNRNVMTFKLTANAVEDIIIPTGNNISIATSNISGLVKTDLTNIELFTDPNGDGSINDGTSIADGTLGDIAGGNGLITFNLNTQQTVAASVYMNYILQLDTTANWGDGDTFTFAANSISITASGVTSQQAASVTGSITQRAFVNPTASAGIPIYQSSEITKQWDVSITFNENMESTVALDGKEGQFTVKVNGTAVAVSDLQLTSTPNKIKLVLATKVTSGQVVTVKYTKDADASKQVKAAGGGVLESFNAQTVTNAL